jgi:hypothetical protein
MQLRLRVKGNDEEVVESRFNGGDFPTCTLSDERPLNIGDTIQVAGFQVTGGAVSIQVDAGYGSTFLVVSYMGPS